MEVFDQQPEEGFRLSRVCFGDRALELVGDRFEVGAVGRCVGLCGELPGEVGILFAQAVEAPLEGGHALLEAGALEVAAFEGAVVAVEGALAAADLLGERPSAFFHGRPPGLLLGGSLIDGFVDERSVAVERGELLENSRFELVAGDALAVAARAAELLPARAGVVVVGAAVAAGAHADVSPVAAAAPDEPGEEVVAGVAAA